MEGFKKLLCLLSKKDENISRIIFKALLHFLNLKELRSNAKSDDFLSEYDSVAQKKIVHIILKYNLNFNFKEEITTIRGKVARIVSEIRKLILGEIERVFKQSSHVHQLKN